MLGIGCWILDICTFNKKPFAGNVANVEMLPVANANNQWRKMFSVLKIDVEAQGETKPHTKGNSNMAMTMLREWNGCRLAGKCPIWHGQDRSHSRGEEELREYSHGYIIYKRV